MARQQKIRKFDIFVNLVFYSRHIGRQPDTYLINHS